MEHDKDILARLWEATYASEPEQIVAVAADGSARRYYRIFPSAGEGATVIGAVGPDRAENATFVYLARHFASLGLPTPRIIAVSPDERAYLQTDCGDTSLFGLLSREGLSPRVREIYARSMEVLADLQYRGSEGIDFDRCYPRAAMDFRAVMWDLNYFKYCFLKATGAEFSEDRLEDEFERFAAMLAVRPDETTLMIRDYQSRNILVSDYNRPVVIDFQGARRGATQYDVASMLWQARAGLPDYFRREMVECYLDRAESYTAIDREDYRRRLQLFVLFRTLQVLGAYGYRGYIEHKAHFVASIPGAIANLRRAIAPIAAELPYLAEVLRRVCDLPRYAPVPKHEGLTVRVVSFSYKRGIPDDATGNGGGFVFDCRAVHNPGRYAEYKQLTGLDRPVIDFIEANSEMEHFLGHVYGLVDASVERYMGRGFTDLLVCFGCTGGRHRSVYAAEHTARHIHDRFGCAVVIEHREQGISQLLSPQESPTL